MLRAFSFGGARLGPADRGSFGDCGWRGFLLSRGVAGGVVLGLADVRQNPERKGRIEVSGRTPIVWELLRIRPSFTCARSVDFGFNA